ncbi:hypothetical protein PsorP6_009438 [Peronosclerospora sorghi]|uniref:Uncharacterized protein n=1 Tax=Peronosclerospora sorghi TaxID=230839 RepID=A0ACC0VYW5_9STRA|nr:hypothetical protein PsorP6_009438 [Peronosclerospora sorghi]
MEKNRDGTTCRCGASSCVRTGAGGNGNVLKEIVEESNAKPGDANHGGARYEVRNVLVGDETLSVREIWGAEYQENDALLLRPEYVNLFDKICKRENCPYALLRKVTGDGRVVLHDSKDDSIPFDLDLDLVQGKIPQKTFTDTKVAEPLSALSLPVDLTLRDALDRVLRLLSSGVVLKVADGCCPKGPAMFDPLIEACPPSLEKEKGTGVVDCRDEVLSMDVFALGA